MLWRKLSFLLFLATNVVYGSHLRTSIDMNKNVIGPRKLQNQDKIIKGINWFGFETEYKDLMCTWAHSIDWHLHKIKEVGFNYIRLPFSLEFVQEGNWSQMDEFFEKSNLGRETERRL